MIEAVMLVALGFLGATLCWLIMLPAISRRADRLARRRAELTFPLSVEEIAAERDHLRAQFAVRERELERKADERGAARAQALAALGQREMDISELKTTLGVRDLAIADLQGQAAGLTADLAAVRARLADEEAQHASARSDLAIRGQALAERDKDVAALRIERADLTAALASRTREFEAAHARAEALDGALARTGAELRTLQDQHDALSQEKDRLRIALAESETLAMTRAASIEDLSTRLAAAGAALEGERAGHETTRTALEQRGHELGSVRDERDGLRQRLKAADDRAADLEQLLKETRAARETVDAMHSAARREVEALTAGMRELKAERAKAEVELATSRRELEARSAALSGDLAGAQEALSQIRAERATLRQEIASLRREADRAEARQAAENLQLRGEIVKVADLFMEAGRAPAGLAQAPLAPGRRMARKRDPRAVPDTAAE